MCNILNIFQPCLMKLHRLGWKVSWHWPEILQKIRNQYEIKFLQTINTEGCIISPFYIVILAKDQLVVYTTSDLSLLFSVFFIRSINTNPTLFLSSVSTIRLLLLLLILLQIERKKKKKILFFLFFTMRYRFNASNPILHPTRFFFYFLLYLKKKKIFFIMILVSSFHGPLSGTAARVAWSKQSDFYFSRTYTKWYGSCRCPRLFIFVNGVVYKWDVG